MRTNVIFQGLLDLPYDVLSLVSDRTGLLTRNERKAIMYSCMVFGLAEMSSAMPVAGAGYGFARRALGPLGGFATGMAVLIEYAVAPAAIAVFIGGYVEALGLFGLTNGRSLEDCGKLGSIAAAAVIGHIGPRPGLSLAQMISLVD